MLARHQNLPIGVTNMYRIVNDTTILLFDAFGDHVPQFSTSSGKSWSQTFIPSIGCLGYRIFVEGTISENYPGWCYLPVRFDVAYPLPLTLSVGTIVKVVPQKNVSLLVQMGVLEPVRSGVVLHEGQEGLESLQEEYAGLNSGLGSRFRVIADLDDVPCPPQVIGEVDITMTLLENLDENFSMARYAWTLVLVTREP
jgi:hypothetical protein